jgi:hypothetical protein
MRRTKTAAAKRIDPAAQEGTDWTVRAGALQRGAGSKRFEGSRERLTYNNPFKQSVERVWFDGKLVYAVDCGEVDIDPGRVKVAQEYAVVYSLKPDGTPAEEVKGQYNIYDSVPGMDKYSPLWRFNYVVVPEDYEPNSLRSERDVLRSGYPVHSSKKIEN